MKKFYAFAMLAAALTLFAAEKPKTIVFTGDSIADGVGASKKANRFSTVAVRLLNQSAGRKAYKELNIASSGSTMTNQPWHGVGASGYPYQLKRAIAAKPDIVIVQHGVNDNSIGCSFAEYAWSYRQFVRELRAALPDAVIVCMTITPTDRKGEKARLLDMMNVAIQEIAAWEKTLLVHTAAALNDSLEFFPDHLHPNDTGHRIIAEALVKVIKENKPMSENDFQLVVPHPGIYHICGYHVTVPPAAGITRFSHMGKNGWVYSTLGTISISSSFKQYAKPFSCQSDSGKQPVFKWEKYRGFWTLPPTDGKAVKVTITPDVPPAGKK